MTIYNKTEHMSFIRDPHKPSPITLDLLWLYTYYDLKLHDTTGVWYRVLYDIEGVSRALITNLRTREDLVRMFETLRQLEKDHPGSLHIRSSGHSTRYSEVVRKLISETAIKRILDLYVDLLFNDDGPMTYDVWDSLIETGLETGEGLSFIGTFCDEVGIDDSLTVELSVESGHTVVANIKNRSEDLGIDRTLCYRSNDPKFITTYLLNPEYYTTAQALITLDQILFETNKGTPA